MARQGLTRGIAELGHTRLDVESRADRPQSIVAMRDGRSEKGHNCIADMLFHGAAILGNNGIGPGIEGLDQPPEILGIQPSGKRSKSAKISEEDRHLSALTLNFRARRSGCGDVNCTDASGSGRAASAATTEGLPWRICKAAIRTSPAYRRATFGAELASFAIVEIALRATHHQTPARYCSTLGTA